MTKTLSMNDKLWTGSSEPFQNYTLTLGSVLGLLSPVLAKILLSQFRKLYHPWNLITLFCCSIAQSSLTLCDPMDCSTPGFPVLHYSPELAQTHVHQVSDAIKASRALLPLLVLPSVCPSIRVFSNESVLHIRWPKYWSISFSISPFNEYSGLISFRIDWLALLAVQGTLKSLLHNSKASILWHSVVFIVQLSHPHMTTGKTIALSRQTFVGKVMSLLLLCCVG